MLLVIVVVSTTFLLLIGYNLTQIYDRLVGAGYEIWMDKGQLKGNIYQKMAEGVNNAHLVLMFTSANYEKSQHCQREASLAADKGKHVIPIRVQQGYEPDGWLSK